MSATAPRPGPPLWLLLELTYRCPLHCAFCSNPVDFARVQSELSTEEWFRVLAEARSLGATAGKATLEGFQKELLKVALQYGLTTSPSLENSNFVSSVVFDSSKPAGTPKERFAYVFHPWQPPHFYRPVLVPHPAEPGDTIAAAGMDVRLFAQDHGRLETLGLRIGAFGYSTDVVALNDEAFAALDGIDTWVVGCFLRQGPHWTHADLPTVLGWVDRLQPRRTVLTHMSTDMDWAWLAANLPAGIEAGYDGMVLEV